MASAGDITRLLAALRSGDAAAESDLASLVYTELHALANRHMRRERADHTLQPTALVHEAYLRLMQSEAADWRDRAHFFAAASVVMRRVLVDYARQRRAAKRPDGNLRVDFGDLIGAHIPHLDELLVVDDALRRLEAMDARQARLVEMRYYGGLTEEEAAEVLGVSVRTVKRDWRAARAWLHAQLAEGPA